MYVEQMLARAGERDAKSAAARIAALETRIANYQWTKVQNRDPVKTYNPMTLPEYQKLAPGFDWLAFFEGMGAPVQKSRRQPALVHQGHRPAGEDRAGVRLARCISNSSCSTTTRRCCRRSSPTSNSISTSSTLNGVPEPLPRWRQAVDSMDDNMGELIGRMFVEAHFGAEAKARMLELVGNLLKAFDTSIDGLEWMSPATRAEAKKKLSKITVKIGYPDKWRDYSALSVRSDDLVGNLLRASRVRAPAIRGAHRRPGRQGRVADDAADRQRVLQLRPPTRSRSRPPSCAGRSSTWTLTTP